MIVLDTPHPISHVFHILHYYGTFVTINQLILIHYYSLLLTWIYTLFRFPYFLSVPLFCPSIPFRTPHYYIQLSCLLGFSWLWWLFRFCLVLVTLFWTVLRSTGQIFCMMTSKWYFSDFFSQLDWGYGFGGGRPEVKWHSHHSMSRILYDFDIWTFNMRESTNSSGETTRRSGLWFCPNRSSWMTVTHELAFSMFLFTHLKTTFSSIPKVLLFTPAKGIGTILWGRAH